MKFTWLSKAFLLMLLCVSLYACKDKKNTTTTPATTPIGGKGGLATMRVILDHDSIYVDSGKVYIKYNSLVSPTDKKYDDSSKIIMVDGTPMAIFTSLKEGDYYFYGTGWDIIRSKTVWGIRPYTITAAASSSTSYLVLQAVVQ